RVLFRSRAGPRDAEDIRQSIRSSFLLRKSFHREDRIRAAALPLHSVQSHAIACETDGTQPFVSVVDVYGSLTGPRDALDARRACSGGSLEDTQGRRARAARSR